MSEWSRTVREFLESLNTPEEREERISMLYEQAHLEAEQAIERVERERDRMINEAIWGRQFQGILNQNNFEIEYKNIIVPDDYQGGWTYAVDDYPGEWENETFDTKEEAIQVGKEAFNYDEHFYIGRVYSSENFPRAIIANIEMIEISD